MVWNNLVALFAFITFATTSSIDFGVLVYVVGSLDPSRIDPNSCIILLPNSNSNGNPSTNYGLLGGTCNSISLNFSKAGCVAIFSVCNLLACRPSCVCCCSYKCYCKIWKCFGLIVVSIQSSHASPSKCRCSSPLETLCHVPF
jgi:hypothetical protein